MEMKEESLCNFPSVQAGVVVENVDLTELHEFHGHPFRVEKDMELFELM